jgi:hypothetical protein
MHKTIFSKIGLGVILTVILGLAAASAPPKPAVAQGGEFRVKAIFQKIDDSRARLLSTTDGKPYNLAITTWWELENYQGCSSDSIQTLDRKAAGGPWERVWSGTGTSPPPKLYTRVWTGRVYIYSLRVACPKGNVVIHVQDAVTFHIAVMENDKPPPGSISYRGQWIKSTSGRPSGGSTHVAKQVGASATMTYGGMAAAWVSTIDKGEASVPARVACDYKLCGTVDTAWPGDGLFDGLLYGQYKRVVWSNTWSSKSSHNVHRVQVIADDPSDVDVDALLLVAPA